MISVATLTDAVYAAIPNPYASLLNGILLGVPLASSPQLFTDLKTVGLLHMVVLSGTNISFLTAYILKLTSIFKKQISLVVTSVTVILFVLFVGVQAPVLRAAIMGILTLMAIGWGRRRTTFYFLILSGIIMILFHKEYVTDVSFQLSFGATLGIILFAKSNEVNGISLKSYIGDNLRITLAAQLFVIPIIALHFRQFSLISPLANILVAWTVEPLMIVGFLGILSSFIIYPLGLFLLYICYGILSYYLFIVYVLAKLPFANIAW